MLNELFDVINSLWHMNACIIPTDILGSTIWFSNGESKRVMLLGLTGTIYIILFNVQSRLACKTDQIWCSEIKLYWIDCVYRVNWTSFHSLYFHSKAIQFQMNFIIHKNDVFYRAKQVNDKTFYIKANGSWHFCNWAKWIKPEISNLSSEYISFFAEYFYKWNFRVAKVSHILSIDIQ